MAGETTALNATSATSTVAASALNTAELERLVSQARDPGPLGVQTRSILQAAAQYGEASGTARAGDAQAIAGLGRNSSGDAVSVLARIDPKMAQAVLDRQWETTTAIMKGWSESIARNAKADKEASAKHAQLAEVLNRAANTAQRRGVVLDHYTAAQAAPPTRTIEPDTLTSANRAVNNPYPWSQRLALAQPRRVGVGT